jgi:hypothetical protein
LFETKLKLIRYCQNQFSGPETEFKTFKNG